MKKLLSFVISLALCAMLIIPASAYEMGRAGGYIPTISTGAFHSAAVDENGVLWMWGFNSNGQIVSIDGEKVSYNNYAPIKTMENVAAVSCGDYHAAAIKTDGSLWMWGLNDEGQLGNGGEGNIIGSNDTLCQNEPVHVLDDVVTVSCGGRHTAVIKTDGSLWMWGSNLFGELGNGGKGNDTYARGRIQTVPIKIMDDVVAVSCGFYTTAAIKADGSLWMWGFNNSGQLGNGGEGNAKREGMTIQTVPIKIMDDVVAVSCASGHTAAIKADSSLWMWGVNYYGQLGNDEYGDDAGSSVPMHIMDGVSSVSCHGSNTAAIKTDGSLWMWGNNHHGELGNNGIGNITVTGGNIGMTIQTVPTKVMDGVAAVSCGSVYTVAAKDDGSLWAWGSNNYGQLGTGYYDSRYYNPIAVKNDITVATPSGTITTDTSGAPSDWAKDEVAAAITAGLVPENLQKDYRLPVSRGDVARMFIILIDKSSGKDVAEIMSEKGVEPDENAFTDTDDKAVLEANALGIINGVGGNKFNPNGAFIRAQAAAIINRIARLLNVETEGYSHGFTDVTDHWVNVELGWPSCVGIIKGVGDNKFDPDADLTMEQTILITYRALQTLKK